MNIRASRSTPPSRVASTIAIAAALCAAPALAQTSPEADDAGAAEAGVPEIVVTAQRVSENLQDVPLAITAISGAMLAEKNITDVTRLQDIAPGLSIGRSGSDARPNIRGINT